MDIEMEIANVTGNGWRCFELELELELRVEGWVRLRLRLRLRESKSEVGRGRLTSFSFVLLFSANGLLSTSNNLSTFCHPADGIAYAIYI